MGKGDQRTKRGKLFAGSHGKTRPGKTAKAKPVKVVKVEPVVIAETKAPKAPRKKKE
jgi:ribosomal small subunit protein bTHX